MLTNVLELFIIDIAIFVMSKSGVTYNQEFFFQLILELISFLMSHQAFGRQ